MQSSSVLILFRIILGAAAAYAFVNGFRSDASVLWYATALAGFAIGEIAGMSIARSKTETGAIFGPMAASMARLTMLLAFVIADVIPWWMFVVFFYFDALAGLVRIFTTALNHQSTAPRTSLPVALLVASVFCIMVLCLVQVQGIRIMPGKLLGFHPGFWVLLTPALMSILASIRLFADPTGVIQVMMKPRING